MTDAGWLLEPMRLRDGPLIFVQEMLKVFFLCMNVQYGNQQQWRGWKGELQLSYRGERVHCSTQHVNYIYSSDSEGQEGGLRSGIAQVGGRGVRTVQTQSHPPQRALGSTYIITFENAAYFDPGHYNQISILLIRKFLPTV